MNAAIFCTGLLGSSHDFRLREMHAAAKDVLAQRMADAKAELLRIQRIEEGRDYYEYQSRYYTRGQTTNAVTFQQSDLARKPLDPASWSRRRSCASTSSTLSSTP